MVFDSLRGAPPCNVSNTTHVVERCHPQRNRRGGNLPPATSRIQPVWLNETTPDMSFRANAVSRGIYSSCNFYLVSVPLPTWWIPPLRFAPVGMTKTGYVSTDSPTVSRVFYAAPRPSSVSPAGEPASPKGSSCTVLLGVWFPGTTLQGANPRRKNAAGLQFMPWGKAW